MLRLDEPHRKIIGCEIDADLVKPEVWFYNQQVYERAIERMKKLGYDTRINDITVVQAGRMRGNAFGRSKRTLP